MKNYTRLIGMLFLTLSFFRLAVMTSASPVASLVSVLQSENAGAKTEALQSLIEGSTASHNWQELITHILAASTDTNQQVRCAAFAALAFAIDSGSITNLEQFQKSEPIFRQGVTNGSSDSRSLCIRILSRVDTQGYEALQLLKVGVSSEAIGPRASAFDGLTYMANRGNTNALAELISQASVDLKARRILALEALGRLEFGSRLVITTIVSHIKDSDRQIQLASLSSLDKQLSYHEYQTEGVFGPLYEVAIEDGMDVEVKTKSARILGKMLTRSPANSEWVSGKLHAGYPAQMRRDVMRILSCVSNLPPVSVEFIQNSLADPDEVVREDAAKILKQFR